MAKKVKRNERQESKRITEKSEAEKRRDRRLARKARAAQVVDEPQRPADGIKSLAFEVDSRYEGKAGRGNSVPDERAGVIFDPEENRVKTVITTDNLLKILEEGDEAKIEFCDEHHDALVRKLTLHKLDSLFTDNNEDLVERLRARKIEPLFQCCEALIKLSVQVIGTEGVVKYRCPICAFKQFDFLGQIASAFRDAVIKQKRAVQ